MTHKTEILVRADSGHNIGIGHVMRDLVLAKQLKLIENVSINFATQNIDGNINYKILAEKYEIVNLQTDDVEELIYIIKSKKINILIIDNYDIDFVQESIIKEQTNVKILAIDDKYLKHNCDILLNHNISSNKDKYLDLIPKECKVFAGVEYALIRDEFKNINIENTRELKINRKNKIFISIGGSDHLNLNKQLVKLLSNNYILNIVTTKANKNLQELISLSNSFENINLFVDNNEMAKIINECDFAIISASVVAMEIIFMELPFIAIKTIDNQINMFNFLNNNNFIAINVTEIIEVKSLLLSVLASEIKYKELYINTKECKNNMSSKLHEIIDAIC